MGPLTEAIKEAGGASAKEVNNDKTVKRILNGQESSVHNVVLRDWIWWWWVCKTLETFILDDMDVDDDDTM